MMPLSQKRSIREFLIYNVRKEYMIQLIQVISYTQWYMFHNVKYTTHIAI